MSVVSFRINDEKKEQAELIARDIGMSLSNVLSVLLNRFIAEKGFPFSVTAPNFSQPVYDRKNIENQVLEAVKNCDSPKPELHSAYIDSDGIFHPSSGLE